MANQDKTPFALPDETQALLLWLPTVQRDQNVKRILQNQRAALLPSNIFALRTTDNRLWRESCFKFWDAILACEFRQRRLLSPILEVPP